MLYYHIVCVSKLKTPPNSTFEMINLKSRNPWTLGLCRDLRHRYIHLLGNPCKFPLAKSNFRSCALGCLRFRHRDTQEATSAAVIRKRFSLSLKGEVEEMKIFPRFHCEKLQKIRNTMDFPIAS